MEEKISPNPEDKKHQGRSSNGSIDENSSFEERLKALWGEEKGPPHSTVVVSAIQEMLSARDILGSMLSNSPEYTIPYALGPILSNRFLFRGIETTFIQDLLRDEDLLGDEKGIKGRISDFFLEIKNEENSEAVQVFDLGKKALIMQNLTQPMASLWENMMNASLNEVVQNSLYNKGRAYVRLFALDGSLEYDLDEHEATGATVNVEALEFEPGPHLAAWFARAIVDADPAITNEQALKIGELWIRRLAAVVDGSEDRARESITKLFTGVAPEGYPRKEKCLQVRIGTAAWAQGHFGLGVVMEWQFRFHVIIEGKPEGARILTHWCHSFPFSLKDLEDHEFAAGEEAVALFSEYLQDPRKVEYLVCRMISEEKEDEGSDDDSEAEEEEEDILDDAETEFEQNKLDRAELFIDPEARPKASGSLNHTAPVWSEVWCWGKNQDGCLSLSAAPHSMGQPTEDPSSDYRQPCKGSLTPTIPQLTTPLLPMETIRCIATSARHTVAVTSMGTVLSCGDGFSGALGHGDTLSSSFLRYIEWFLSQSPAITIGQAWAGSDTLGCHSAAMDTEGRLYTWGLGCATGHGSLKPVLLPRAVRQFQEEGGLLTAGCGGAYTVAVKATGEIYSWGFWVYGRLGLGKAPVRDSRRFQRRRRFTQSRQRITRYQLVPKQMPKMKGVQVEKVACGTAHGLCISSGGHVWAWGRNDSGQLGCGPTLKGELREAHAPFQLAPFTSTQKDGMGQSGLCRVRAMQVACGTSHSAVVDHDGALWTWGAEGALCLGHGDASGSQMVAVKDSQKVVAKPGTTRTKYNPQPWMFPRKVASLADVSCVRVDCGDSHTAAVDKNGKFYLWGEGLCVVGPRDKNKVPEESPSPDDTSLKESELLKLLPPTPIPRSPTEHWLAEIATQRVGAIACSGQHIFVLTIGEQIGHSMGKSLFRNALRAGKSLEEDSDSEDVENSSIYNGPLQANRRFGVDCMLLVAGRYLYCHKIVISRRSPVLREMLAEEERPTDTNLVELLIPDVTYQVARTMLEFMYCDNILSMNILVGSMPYDLLSAAHLYQIPRLKALCQNLLALPPDFKFADEEELDVNIFEALVTPVPTSTLPMDFGGLLGDSQYADVKFVAEGRTIYAHRVFLEAGSEYFQAMFRFLRQRKQSGNESDESKSSLGSTRSKSGRLKVMEVVVPDSHIGLLRLLLFIYTGTVASAPAEVLLQDMVSSDRYRLLDMKEYCQNMINIDVDNCLQVLQASNLVNATQLNQMAMFLLTRNLDSIYLQPGFHKVVQENPQLTHDIFDRLKLTYSSISKMEKVSGLFRKKQRHPVLEAFGANEPFSWTMFGIGILCVILYYNALNVIIIGPYVPVINILFSITFLYFCYSRFNR